MQLVMAIAQAAGARTRLYKSSGRRGEWPAPSPDLLRIEVLSLAVGGSLRSRCLALPRFFGRLPGTQSSHGCCRRIFPVLVLVPPLGFRAVVILSHVKPSLLD